MGRKGIIGLKTRVGQECSISRGGQIVQWRYTGQRSLRRESQCYNGGCSRGAPRVRAAKSSEFGGEKLCAP